ncbi:MAG: hypothetical protein K8S99_13920 [Planctomycetes bacterium]|nr:hypothetical protein [Planctomycetota bacterium]
MNKTTLSALLFVTALAGLLTLSRDTAAFPEPAAAPRGWLLDFTHSKPTPIALQAADGKVRWFWYMTYKVQNNTGQNRIFIPEVTIASDQGDVVTAGKDVPATVFAAVKDRVGNKLLSSPTKVVGRILEGEDMAKESVIVWSAFDHDVDHVSIFISGLSGETQIIPNPQTGDPVATRRTLMVEYNMPGTGGSPQDQAVVPAGETWVMR